MAINPSFTTTVSMVDRSGESTSWSVPTSQANIDEGYANVEYSALQSAALALIDGVVVRVNFNQTHRTANASNATDGQREQKYLVTYEDNTTLAKYSFELPCRQDGIKPPLNTDEYDLSVAPFPAFISALEAYALSPDGNAINVVSIRLMGKNT